MKWKTFNCNSISIRLCDEFDSNLHRKSIRKTIQLKFPKTMKSENHFWENEKLFEHFKGLGRVTLGDSEA